MSDCAADGYSGYFQAAYDSTTPLTISLKRIANGGSISIRFTAGTIPGLSGILNPLFDSLKRTYLYTRNISINGGQSGQPVGFSLQQPIVLEDKYGHNFEIKFLAIATDSSLIEYRRM